MNLRMRAIAEFVGTFWLVFGGCGRGWHADIEKPELGAGSGMLTSLVF